MELLNESVTNNTYSMNDLNILRISIENMNKFNQIEVLRILNKYKNVILNENKYGTHVNLTELSPEILDELNTYVKYVNTQEKTLDDIERQKEDYYNTFFVKDIKDNTSNMSIS